MPPALDYRKSAEEWYDKNIPMGGGPIPGSKTEAGYIPMGGGPASPKPITYGETIPMGGSAAPLPPGFNRPWDPMLRGETASAPPIEVPSATKPEVPRNPMEFQEAWGVGAPTQEDLSGATLRNLSSRITGRQQAFEDVAQGEMNVREADRQRLAYETSKRDLDQQFAQRESQAKIDKALDTLMSRAQGFGLKRGEKGSDYANALAGVAGVLQRGAETTPDFNAKLAQIRAQYGEGSPSMITARTEAGKLPLAEREMRYKEGMAPFMQRHYGYQAPIPMTFIEGNKQVSGYFDPSVGEFKRLGEGQTMKQISPTEQLKHDLLIAKVGAIGRALQGTLPGSPEHADLMGQLKTIEGLVAPGGGAGQTVSYQVNGRTFNIPQDKVDYFLSKNPNAKRM